MRDIPLTGVIGDIPLKGVIGNIPLKGVIGHIWDYKGFMRMEKKLAHEMEIGI